MLSRSLLGWTCGFYDFDLDGDEDLFVVNGHVYPEATMETMDSPRNQPVLMLERTGNRFTQVKMPGEYLDRSAVFGDLDNDGDTDAIVAQRSGDVRVLQNDSVHGKPRIVQLIGNNKNPRGLGAKIIVTHEDGRTTTRWNTDGFGFQSSFAVPKHFFIKPIKTIEVIWSNGKKQTISNVPTDDLIVIKQN